MANPEHLALLIQGVEAWNTWRKEHPDITPDLSAANLIGANLRGADLRQAHLSEAYPMGADLREANLFGADLNEADLCEAGLHRANLMEAGLRGAVLAGAHLTEADLLDAKLSQAHLSGADLRAANLTGADLREAVLSWADLTRADLTLANLSGAGLRQGWLSGANLHKANLSGADLRWALLNGADLGQADLGQANLNKGNLYGADLREADLRGASLVGANLNGANLNRAKAGACRLLRADLGEANLSGADVSGADLREADLRAARLMGADLTGANLTSADLRNTLWSQVKATDAILEEAKLLRWRTADCDLTGAQCSRADFADWNDNEPQWRHFAPGEFEQIYGQLFAVEVLFDPGTPVSVIGAAIELLSSRIPDAAFDQLVVDQRGPAGRWRVLQPSLEDARERFDSELRDLFALLGKPADDQTRALARMGSYALVGHLAQWHSARPGGLFGPLIQVTTIQGDQRNTNVLPNAAYYESFSVLLTPESIGSGQSGQHLLEALATLTTQQKAAAQVLEGLQQQLAALGPELAQELAFQMQTAQPTLRQRVLSQLAQHTAAFAVNVGAAAFWSWLLPLLSPGLGPPAAPPPPIPPLNP